MKPVFVILTLGLAFIIGGGSKGQLLAQGTAVSAPDPWSEFVLMRSAMAKARSWRYKMVMTGPKQDFEMESEVVCPDKQHSKMKGDPEVTGEIYLISGTMYIRQGGRTQKVPGQMPMPPFVCGLNAAAFKFIPGLKDLDPSTDFSNIERYKQNMTITKGGISAVEGSPCQEWTVVYNDPQKKTSYTTKYCTGVSDHLPRHMIMDATSQEKTEVTYWDWNSNISITPPTT
jgi:hypothetical protein